MLTCSWSGSTAPGAKRNIAVIRPVWRSISSVFTSQPGNRVCCHSIFGGPHHMRMLVGGHCRFRGDGVHGGRSVGERTSTPP